MKQKTEFRTYIKFHKRSILLQTFSNCNCPFISKIVSTFLQLNHSLCWQNSQKKEKEFNGTQIKFSEKTIGFQSFRKTFCSIIPHVTVSFFFRFRNSIIKRRIVFLKQRRKLVSSCVRVEFVFRTS